MTAASIESAERDMLIQRRSTMEIKKSVRISPSLEQASSADKADASSDTKTIQTGISSNTKDSWQDMARARQNGGAVDPNALVQHVLRESYLQTTEDLKSYAEKVKYFNESKKGVRDYLQGLRDAAPELKAEFSALQPGEKNSVLEAVTRAIQDSVQENNETKQHYLDVLSSMNKISNYVADQNQRIADASTLLATKEKDDDD
jgi:hypothetical protein